MIYTTPNRFGQPWSSTISFSGSKSLSRCESCSWNRNRISNLSESASKRRAWIESISRSSKGIYA